VIVALTRIISAVFRKGGDVTFLVDELKACSTRAAVTGSPAESHALDHRRARLCHREAPAEHRSHQEDAARSHSRSWSTRAAEFQARARQADAFAKSHFPEARSCVGGCSHRRGRHDGRCMTCLNCGDSKCG